MRQAVLLLNVLSVVAAILVLPVALYVGAWGLLGPAYGEPQTLVFGLLIMAAPFIVTGLSIYLSRRSLASGKSYAPVIAGAPLLAVAGVFASPYGRLLL